MQAALPGRQVRMAPLDFDRRLLCVHGFAGNVSERHNAIASVSMPVSTVVAVELLSGKVRKMQEENAILKPTPLLAHQRRVFGGRPAGTCFLLAGF